MFEELVVAPTDRLVGAFNGATRERTAHRHRGPSHLVWVLATKVELPPARNDLVCVAAHLAGESELFNAGVKTAPQQRMRRDVSTMPQVILFPAETTAHRVDTERPRATYLLAPRLPAVFDVEKAFAVDVSSPPGSPFIFHPSENWPSVPAQ